MRLAPNTIRAIAIVTMSLLVTGGGACASKSNVVLVATPILTPNPVVAGNKFVIVVGVLDALGCDKATIAVSYNGAAVSSKQVAVGAQYRDSTNALASGTISARGTCGEAIQVVNEVLTVN